MTIGAEPMNPSRSSGAGRARVWSAFVHQEDRRHRPIPLGDDIKVAEVSVVTAENSITVLKGTPILIDIFNTQISPDTTAMKRNECENGLRAEAFRSGPRGKNASESARTPTCTKQHISFA